MKLYLVIMVICLAFAATVYADKAELVRDSVGAKVQGFAPNGKDDVALTVNSRTIDMSDDIAWGIYVTGATCKFKTMSTATKSGLNRTAPANVWTVRNVHPKSMFINFTGCTSGELQRQ